MKRRRFLDLVVRGGAAVGLFASAGCRIAADALVSLGVPLPWYRSGNVVTTFNYCDMCAWRCGIVVSTVNGRVAKIDGNPKDPKSRGMLCARGQAGVSFLYDPDRLRTPLIRTGERGEGKFRPASWDEALDLVAEKMLAIRDAYGPEAVAFFGHGSGDAWFTDVLPQAWGSPNAARPSMGICSTPREEAALLTVGRAIGNHEPVDWEHARCVTLIGSHFGENAHNSHLQGLADAKARGATIVVVDPRYSTAAMKADHWLPIKPGTDTALLLAWMHVLIAEGLYDREYVERWTVGFDELAAHVRDTTPEWAAPITDIPADLIRATARAMGRARPASLIVPGRHTVWYGNDTQRMRAVYIVDALLGAWGRPGGLYLGRSVPVEEYPHPPYAVAGGAGG